MALSIAELEAGIAALTQAIGSGERQVTIGSQSISYRSIADLIAARNELRTDLARLQAEAAGTTPRPKQTRLYYAGRGF